MSSLFLNQRLLRGQSYQNLSPYHSNTKQGLFAIMSNSNSIQLYRVLSDGLAIQLREEISANIVRMEVLPAKEGDDWVWVLDQMGRFGCWNEKEGVCMVDNGILNNLQKKMLTQIQQNGQNPPILSGVTYNFQQKNTYGKIMYIIEGNLTVLPFEIIRGILSLGTSHSHNLILNNRQLIYANWINNSTNAHLGLVVQEQETTVLEVYAFKEGGELNTYPLWTLRKKNILHFTSHGSDILLTTYDQVSLHKLKQDNPLRCFRTKGNYGHGFYLGDGFYGHLGQQLVLFSKDELRTFRDFRFEDQSLFRCGGIIQAVCLGRCEGRVYVGMVTHRRQVYLLGLEGGSCGVDRQNVGRTNVNSCYVLSGNNGSSSKFVMSVSGDQSHSVLLCQQTKSSIISLQQQLPQTIDRLLCPSPQYLILSTYNTNIVLHRLPTHKQYNFHFQLPKGYLLAAGDDWLVLSTGVYQIGYGGKYCQARVMVPVVMGEVVNQMAYFLTEGGSLCVCGENGSPQVVVQGCNDDYVWGSSQTSNTLICANLSTPTILRLVHSQTLLVSKCTIKGHTLISSIFSIRPFPKKKQQHFLIAYQDGHLHIQNKQHLLSVLLLPVMGLVRMVDGGGMGLVVVEGRVFRIEYGGYQWQEMGMGCRQSFIEDMVYVGEQQLMYLFTHNQQQILRICTITNPIPITRIYQLLQTQTTPYILPIKQQSTILVGLPGQLIQIDLRTTKTKQHSHLLSYITAMEIIQDGILLAGSDCNNTPTVILVDSMYSTVAVYTDNIKTPILALKPIQNNNILIATNTDISLHHLTPHHLHHHLGTHLPIYPHSIDLTQNGNIFLVNDHQKYLQLYHKGDQMTTMGQYHHPFRVVKAAFIGQKVIVADQCNQIWLISVDLHISGRVNFSTLGQIRLEDRVAVFAQKIGKEEEQVWYVTEDGSVYGMRAVGHQEFNKMRRVEEEGIRRHAFRYWPWRNKLNLDRMIDGVFVNLVQQMKQDLTWPYR